MNCSICEIDIKNNSFNCKFCGDTFCYQHQLPEIHKCYGLENWKEEKLGTKSKAGEKKLLYGTLPAHGYFPKVFEIKNEENAEQLVREFIVDKYEVKEFLPNSIKNEFSKEKGTCIVKGSFKTSNFLGIGSRIKSFEITVNMVNGKIEKSTIK